MDADGHRVDMDESLVADLKRRDEAAFSLLMDRYMGLVHGIACRYLGDREEGADVAQEVFLKVYRHIDRFSEKSRFSTWIYRITVNTSIAVLRKRGRQVEAQAESLDRTDWGDGDERPRDQEDDRMRNPRQQMEDKEWDGILQDQLMALPENCRITFILREMRQMSYEEIAETLEIPIGTVRSRLHQARSRLRELLAPYLETEPRRPNSPRCAGSMKQAPPMGAHNQE